MTAPHDINHFSVAATPMAFVRSMVTGAERLGHDPRQALAASHIPKDVLQQIDARITAEQMERLSSQLMREMDDEGLGWFARRLPWGSYGMLARASITAPDLGLAIRRWCRHHALLTTEVELQLSYLSSDIACLTLTETNPGSWLQGEMREFCHVSLLRNLLGLSSWLADSRLVLSQAEFSFAPPPHADAYGVLFPTQCIFNRPCTRLQFSASYLQLPLRRDENALNLMLLRALPLTVRRYRKDRLLAERVRLTLKANPQAMRKVSQVADLLNVSARTLHRQLREQGTTLQTIKNDVRIELANELLLRTHMPIKRIALAIGFDNDKSFIRAYRNLTGATPETRRRQGSD